MDSGSFFLINDVDNLKDSLTQRDKLKLPIRKMPIKFKRCVGGKVANVTVSSETGESSLDISNISECSTSFSESSIEVARDVDLERDIVTPHFTGNIRLWKHNFNSTLNEDIHSAPIAKVDDSIVGILSPIEGCMKHVASQSDSNEFILGHEAEANECLKCTPPHVHHKLTELRKLSKIPEKDIGKNTDEDDWVPKSRDQPDGGCDPWWLESREKDLKLKPLPPRTYTPARKQSSQKLSLPKPTQKRVIRSSSPNPVCLLLPKAKRMLIDTLEISSIRNASLDDDSSLELVPRPDTAGTVNSDEIAASDISNIAIGGGSLSNSPQAKCPNFASQIPPDRIGMLPSPVCTPARTVRTTRRLRHLYYPKDILES